MFGLFSFIGGGILDRFPPLRVGLFEAGAEWLTYLVPRMERYYEVYAGMDWPGLPKGRPADYLAAGNIYLACESDEPSLPQIAELLGEDHLMTSADMPHEEAVETRSRMFRSGPTSRMRSRPKSSARTRRASLRCDGASSSLRGLNRQIGTPTLRSTSPVGLESSARS